MASVLASPDRRWPFAKNLISSRRALSHAFAAGDGPFRIEGALSCIGSIVAWRVPDRAKVKF
jgi:hypothetical protein